MHDVVKTYFISVDSKKKTPLWPAGNISSTLAPPLLKVEEIVDSGAVRPCDRG